jgi:hypothetical protein
LKINKIEIARRQIDVAIDMLRANGDYLAIIALAGAAEEILGAFLKRQKKMAMLDYIIKLDTDLTGGRPFNLINTEINSVRNALKHANHQNEDEIEVEFSDALAMLSRAITNYILLGKDQTPKIIWFYNHANKYCKDLFSNNI